MIRSKPTESTFNQLAQMEADLRALLLTAHLKRQMALVAHLEALIAQLLITKSAALDVVKEKANERE